MPAPSPDAAAPRHLFPGLPLGFEEPDSRLALSRRTLAMAAENPALEPLARGMAAWTWQRDPLSQGTCRLLLEAGQNGPACGETANVLAQRLDALLSLPFPADDWQALMQSGEHALVLRHLLPRLRTPGTGAAWLARTWDWLMRLGRADLPRDMLEATAWEPALLPLRDRLLAEWTFFYAASDEALERIEALGECFGHWRLLAACEALTHLGRETEARERLETLWRRLPWHPHLTLKLHALRHAPAPARDASDAVVLLYSWNKRDLLRATLEGGAGPDLLGARVAVLDNGSTDGAGDMLRQVRERFPEGALEIVSLPVNVGAPAARNWLLSLPRVRAATHAVFLDDDVVLPKGWLARLLGTARAHPEAGVVGCRIVSASAPVCLQSADYNLLPGRQGVESFPGFPENIHLFDNTASGLDLGLFSYVRRTLSVSGCCHALRVSTLDTVGGFDLRLSPTQFDDLERDLRANLAGVPVLYDGGLAVRHVQHSSLARAKSTAAVGQVLGNKVKLECLYDQEQIKSLAESGLDRLWDDLAVKERELRAETASA
jgi:GT2 family glycosyltransferase